MTAKTITGTYASGYAMVLPVTDLTIAASGYVEGNGVTSPAAGLGAYTVVNDGEIKGGPWGVYLYSGGTLTNGSAAITTAQISGGIGVIVGFLGAGTVVNYATIQGVGVSDGGAEGNGVVLSKGGSVTNGAASDTTALIEGAAAVTVYGHAGTIQNFGTLIGDEAPYGGAVVYLGAGGAVTNGSAADTAAYIGRFNPVIVKSALGTVTNFGTLKGLSGAGYDPATGKASFLLSTGINLEAGGSVTNGTTLDTAASIVGAYGVVIASAAGSVTNDGAISGYFHAFVYFPPLPHRPSYFKSYTLGAGVALDDGGGVTNGTASDTKARIFGYYGVKVLAAAGTVLNFGTMEATGGGSATGVFLGDGGSVVNGSAADTGAVIEAVAAGAFVPLDEGFGIVVEGAGTVTNYGLIAGAGSEPSVKFTSSADRLVVEAGSSFIDEVIGAGGTLELAAGTGTIAGLGSSFNGFATYEVDSGGTWTLSGTNSLGAGQAMTIANGGTLEAQGVVANAGTIAVASTGSETDLRILAAGVTLTGGGKIVLSGAKDRILGFSKTSTLTNVDNTIAGTCIFGAANLLTLVNESKGTIDATGVMTFDTSGATATNAGLMESTTGGLLAVTSTTINQSSGGTLDAAGGMINLTGGSDIIGGVIASTTGWAVRALTGANMLDGTTSTVNLTGTLQVFSGDTLTVVGTINNTGKLNLYGGTVVIGAAGATLLGNGQVNFTASAANAITATAAGATLTNAGNVTFGGGTIGGGTLTLVNQAAGVISNGLSVALTINTGSNTVINAGAIAATAAGGGVTVQSAVNNTGRLIANAGGTLTMNGAVTGAGIGQVNGGELIIAQAFAENVFFLGKGVLELEDSTAYTGKIVGLSNAGTNSLDLTDITFTSGVTKATYSGTTASGTLTVTDGTHTAHIQLVGNYVTSGFTISSDGHGGTTVIDPTPSSPTALTQAMASFQIGAAANPAGPSPGSATNLPLIAIHG